MNETAAPKGWASPNGSVSPVGFVVAGRRVAIGIMAVLSFFGGLCEAVFLTLVTRAAFAVTDGKGRVGVINNWYVSVNQAILLGFSLVVLRLMLAAAVSWRSAVIQASAVADIRHRLASAFLLSSWEVQQAQRSGSLQEFLTTYSGSASAMLYGVSQTVLSAGNLVGLVGLAIAVDPAGAAVLVGSVGLLAVALRPLRRLVRKLGGASTRAGMEFATSVNEVSQLGLELHVFHVQDQARSRVARLVDLSRNQAMKLTFVVGVSSAIYAALAYFALLGALALVAASNATSLTSLGAVMLVMLRSLSYGQAMQSGYTAIAANAPAIGELQSQLATLEAGHRHDGGRSLEHVRAIHAESLSFAYVEGQAVIRDLTFTIEPHEVIGIVGPSGGGKSTLVQLLLGLRDPESGRILVDGREITEYAKSEWARKVTFVPQAAHLIAGTVADNIRFLRSGVSDEDVERAARLAHLHEDVEGFPERYQRQVGEHGGHLSGGQQQRLCIARALVESPDLLILDEPTSALDVRSEHLVRTTLLSLKERMTVIVIAHRLSTLEICDRIMVIQGGELKGFDAPDQLEATNEFYREALALSGMR